MRVHHLTVTTYQAQHPESLARDALALYDEALVRHAAVADRDPLGDGLRSWLHDRLGATFAGATRVRSDRPVAHDRPSWTTTLADVDLANDDGYAAAAAVWAAATGRDLEAWRTGASATR